MWDVRFDLFYCLSPSHQRFAYSIRIIGSICVVLSHPIWHHRKMRKCVCRSHIVIRFTNWTKRKGFSILRSTQFQQPCARFISFVGGVITISQPLNLQANANPSGKYKAISIYGEHHKIFIFACQICNANRWLLVFFSWTTHWRRLTLTQIDFWHIISLRSVE